MSSQEPQTAKSQEAAAAAAKDGTSSLSSGLSLPSPSEETQKLDVSGDGTTVKLDGLGPIVVNRDGTISRISNWAEMSEIERKNTVRILGKRNMLRMETLQKEDEAK
jgi:hypothetical protein